MLFTLFYLTVVLAELIFAAGFAVIMISLVYSSLNGSPYVPTGKKNISAILDKAGLKPGQKFYELGCGDARVSRIAAREFGVTAVGVDVNPLLVGYARWRIRSEKLKNIEIVKQNIFATDLKPADVLYLFLMPKLISDLVPKLERELKKNTLVISHGFSIIEWKNRLKFKIDTRPYPTYFYRT